MSDENELDLQDSEPSGSESSDENQDEQEERTIDFQTLAKEFALDGWSVDESWLDRKSRKSFLIAGDDKAWKARWEFSQCLRLGIHWRLPNDPPNVNFGTRFSARFYSLPENKELWATLCEQEIQSARRQRREPDDIRSQKVLANEDARTFLVDRHIATLWMDGKELPPRSELTTTESIKRLQTAIRARRFRRAKREENPEAV